jgi:acetylornithine deacetylase
MSDLHTSVTAQTERIVGLCQDLVRINTVNPYSGDADPGGESAGQEYLAPLLRGLGAQVTLFDCPDDIYQRTGILGPRDRNFHARPNLVARFDFGGEGPTLVLNGHMDTVGIDTMPGDALAAELRDGCLHGRGTSDCKGGLTVAVSAIRALLEANVPLRGSLLFQSVVDEECNGGGAGTLACFDAGYTGDMAIFVDGNEDHLTMGCGGCLTADVFVTGKEGHAALGNGVSAIDKGTLIKQAIDAFKRRRETERPDCRVNLGIFRSGVHPAVIPAEAYLSLNIVYDVSEALAAKAGEGAYGGVQIRREFEQAIAEASAADDWLAEHPARVEWVKDLIPYSQDPEAPWVQRFAQAFTTARGQSPEYDRMVAWSDAAHPAALWGVPTVLYGPGVGGTAHSAGEYITIGNLLNCTEVLATFLLQELRADR